MSLFNRSSASAGNASKTAFSRVVDLVGAKIKSGVAPSAMSGNPLLAFESFNTSGDSVAVEAMESFGVALQSNISHGELSQDVNLLALEAYAGNETMRRHVADNMARLGAMSLQLCGGLKYSGSADEQQAALIKLSNEMFNSTYGSKLPDGAVLLQDVSFAGRGDNLMPNDLAAIYASEAFANATVTPESKELNVAFNMLAAVQDPFLEAFYTTVARSPEDNTFKYRVMVDSFYDGHIHSKTTPTERNLGRKNLMAAVRKPDLLDRDELALIPHYISTGADANTDLFLSTDVVKTEVFHEAGNDIPSGPLKVNPNKALDLFTVCAHPQLKQAGVYNETDMIDPSLRLGNLYVELKTGNDHTVKFPASQFKSSAFGPRPNGDMNDFTVQFRTTDFKLSYGVKNTLGTDLTGLDTLIGNQESGYHVLFEVGLTADVNLESGNFRVTGSYVEPKKAYKWTAAKGDVGSSTEEVSLEDATLKAELAKLTPKVSGFDLKANRTNQNLRTTGLLLDYDMRYANWTFLPKSPLRVQHPLGSEENQYPSIDLLVTGARIRKAAEGYRTFNDWEKTLKAITVDYDRVKAYDYRSDLMSVATNYVKPFYREIDFNVLDEIQNLESRTFIENVRAALINQLQLLASDMVYESQFDVAASYLNGGTPQKPKVIIGCSQYMRSFLTTTGDLRLLGDAFDTEVVTSPVAEMKERMYITVTNDTAFDQDGFRLLGFGNCYTFPDVVVKISPHATNGTLLNTTMVIPRYQHVNNLPILGRINLMNLTDLAQAQKSYPVTVKGLVEHKAKA